MSLVGIFNKDTGVYTVNPTSGKDVYVETAKLANGSPWMVIDDATLPDGYFRAAWSWDEDPEHDVVIDMGIAQIVQRDVINLNIPAMKTELNDELNEAIVDGDTAEEALLRAKLKKLKNILSDPRIEAADTAPALKLLTLEYLMDN